MKFPLCRLFGVMLLAGLCGAWLLPASSVRAHVEPDLVNPSWQLDFSFDQPRVIAVKGLDGKLAWYWYLTYQVVNNTGADQVFFPEFIFADDLGQVRTANGPQVPLRVYDAIRQEARKPLLERPTRIVGRLRQGEDFARDGVAVVPVGSEKIASFSIFVGGLTGDVKTVKHPRTGEEVLLRRHLELQYAVPGEPETPQRQAIKFLGQREVMR